MDNSGTSRRAVIDWLSKAEPSAKDATAENGLEISSNSSTIQGYRREGQLGQFHRRARRKTREDRYEKRARREREKAKRDSRPRKRSTPAEKHGRELQQQPKPTLHLSDPSKRLTLQTQRIGLFNHGRASYQSQHPTVKTENNKPCSIVLPDDSSKNKARRHYDPNDEISRFFATGGPGVGIQQATSYREATETDREPPGHHLHPVATLLSPTKTAWDLFLNDESPQDIRFSHPSGRGPTGRPTGYQQRQHRVSGRIEAVLHKYGPISPRRIAEAYIGATPSNSSTTHEALDSAALGMCHPRHDNRTDTRSGGSPKQDSDASMDRARVEALCQHYCSMNDFVYQATEDRF